MVSEAHFVDCATSASVSCGMKRMGKHHEDPDSLPEPSLHFLAGMKLINIRRVSLPPVILWGDDRTCQGRESGRS